MLPRGFWIKKGNNCICMLIIRLIVHWTVIIGNVILLRRLPSARRKRAHNRAQNLCQIPVKFLALGSEIHRRICVSRRSPAGGLVSLTHRLFKSLDAPHRIAPSAPLFLIALNAASVSACRESERLVNTSRRTSHQPLTSPKYLRLSVNTYRWYTITGCWRRASRFASCTRPRTIRPRFSASICSDMYTDG